MQSQLFRGSIVNHHSTREDRPGLEVIGQFSTCAAKSYWIALVLTGDEKKASRIVASGIHEIADSGTVFGKWMCAWGIGVVIKACVALRADELRKEEGSGEYWRAKAAEGPTIELQQAPLQRSDRDGHFCCSCCFRGSYLSCGSSRVIPCRI